MSEISDLLFLHRSYKDYLSSVEQKKLLVQKGFRSRLAAAAQCNTPFISHVLNGDAHLSLEQAMGIGQLLALGEEEQRYFLGLVQFERAGTPSLRAFFKQQLDTLSEHHQTLRTRLKTRDKLSLEDKVRYYSSWEYAAVHVIVTIMDYQQPQEIAKRLQLSESRVHQVLHHLADIGLVTQQGSRFKAGTKKIYLGNDSDLISQHHSNWRVRTLSALTAITDQDLHYSSAITISRADAKKLRRMVVDFIAQVTPLINDSKEEEIFSFCLDLFAL
ncbi:MAG: TIGR02147 family protein [Bdellovibrionales bacterium]